MGQFIWEIVFGDTAKCDILSLFYVSGFTLRSIVAFNQLPNNKRIFLQYGSILVNSTVLLYKRTTTTIVAAILLLQLTTNRKNGCSAPQRRQLKPVQLNSTRQRDI